MAIQIIAQFAPLAEVQADWLIVAAWEDEALPGATVALDAKLAGTLAHLREAGDITGKANEVVPVLGRTDVAAGRILVVGLGKRDTADRARLHDAAAAAARAVTGKKQRRIAFAIPEAAGALGWAEITLAIGVGL